MFVEQLNKKNRTRIGSLGTEVNQRLAANGFDTSAATFEDLSANSPALPPVPVDTGLLGSTRINTPSGPTAISDLRPGQHVMTRTGKPAQISYVLPVEKPAFALRIRAPYFGANQDVIVAKNQFLEIRSEIAEYMFGEPDIVVPAWVFKDNSKVLHHELSKHDQLFQLQITLNEGFGIGECNVLPFLTRTENVGKRFLTDAEARAFATERRTGQYN